MDKPIRKPSFVKRSLAVDGEEYAKLLQQLKDRFRYSQVKAAVRVNTTMLEYYWDMGREISKLHAEAKKSNSIVTSLPVRTIINFD